MLSWQWRLTLLCCDALYSLQCGMIMTMHDADCDSLNRAVSQQQLQQGGEAKEKWESVSQ